MPDKQKYFKVLFALLAPLLCIPVLAMVWPVNTNSGTDLPPEQVNLALRRTLHHLLMENGDSTSAIPPVEQSSERSWYVELNRPFQYRNLPALLQSSLDVHGIKRPYYVTVIRCLDGMIALGYHQQDFLQNKDIPCQCRDQSEECFRVSVTFTAAKVGTAGNKIWWFALAGLLLIAAAWAYNKRPRVEAPLEAEPAFAGWETIGQTRFHPLQQVLECNGEKNSLTFRESKLLQVLAQHPNQLLERDVLQAQVWGEEGILTGRSLDMFISRLRKKLQSDSSLKISAVHGVGYRLEVDG